MSLIFFQGKFESHAEYRRITDEVRKDLEDREVENISDVDTLTEAFLLEKNRLHKTDHDDKKIFS